MLSWLLDNLSSLLLAFIMAITVWVAAVLAEDPSQTITLSDPIVLNYSGLPGELLILGEPPLIGSVTIRGPSSVVSQITPEDVHLVINLTGKEEGEHLLEVEPGIDIRRVQISEFEPQTVRIQLESVATSSFPIEIQTVGEPALGYRAGQISVPTDQVILLGPRSAVTRVDRVYAELDVTGRFANLEQEVQLSPVDENGEVVQGIQEISPASITVSVAIDELVGYRAVSVLPTFAGVDELDEAGYRFTFDVTPKVVTLFSQDLQALDALASFVETLPLNIAAATTDIERRMSLALPANVSLVGGQSVLVRVVVSAKEGFVTIKKQIEVSGLAATRFAVLSPDSVDITLSGPLPTLNNLDPDDVRVFVDLLDLGLGVHQVAPELIIAPTDVLAEPIFPATIEVTITLTPPPTPTPSS
jgi:YbbR domain-containing protein